MSERGTAVQRVGDITSMGRLRVYWDRDGGIHVTVQEDSYSRSQTVAFSALGGHSQETVEALRQLFKAMKRDAEGRPNGTWKHGGETSEKLLCEAANITCSWCGANPRRACKNDDGGKAYELHPERIAEARERIKREQERSIGGER